MKRLVLVSTMALALTVFGGMPAAGAEADTVVQENPSTSDAQPSPPAETDVDPDASGGTEDSTGTADAESGNPEGSTDPSAPAAEVEGIDDASGEETPAEDPEPIDAQISLDKTEVTAEEVNDPEQGIGFTVTGLRAGDTLGWGDGDGIHEQIQEDGSYSGVFSTSETLEPGDTVTVTVDIQRGDQNTSVSATATIIPGDDETEPGTAELSASPETQTLNEFFEQGVRVMMTGCHVDSEVTIQVAQADSPDEIMWEESQTAGEDAAGVFTILPYQESDDAAEYIGEYVVTGVCGDQVAGTTFSVTPNDYETEETSLTIDPKKLSGVDFVNRNKGVTLTVRDCAFDEVRFQVRGFEQSELLYDQTAPTDDAGTAAVQTYGLSDDPAAYVGTYDVIATCGETELTGEFVVTGSGSGGGDGNGNGGGGGSMPRTGAELTGLGAGVILILAGAAAVLFARRRGQQEA